MWKIALLVLLASCVAGAGLMVLWRQADRRADRAEAARLRSLQPEAPLSFTASMVAGLPEAARRYLTYSIAEGTPLLTVVELRMRGRFGLGTRDAPGYAPMTARQVLASPDGFVWEMSGGTGAMRMSGSDSGGWTRFWLWGLVPVARSGGDGDHARSAFARHAAEAAIWTPAALLPGRGVTWEDAGPDLARYTIRQGDLAQVVDIRINAGGQPQSVVLTRWSNANPEATYRPQPFGGTLSGFREFQGFRLATRVEAGNFFGTEDYFPFFLAEVTDLRFPGPE